MHSSERDVNNVMSLTGPFCDRFSIELWQSNYHYELEKKLECNETIEILN